jgi:uncharacterized protein YhbP (UPF0306 family)
VGLRRLSAPNPKQRADPPRRRLTDMKAKLVNPEHPHDRLAVIVSRILAANLLCTMSTTGPGGEPNIFVAFFSFDEELAFHFLSHPQSAHARNVALDPRMAVAVFDQRQPWGAAHVGLQLFGRCTPASDGGVKAVEGNYAARFPLYVDFSNRVDAEGQLKPHAPFYDLRFYTFRPETVKILDEPDFGDQVLVTAAVSA